MEFADKVDVSPVTIPLKLQNHIRKLSAMTKHHGNINVNDNNNKNKNTDNSSNKNSNFLNRNINSSNVNAGGILLQEQHDRSPIGLQQPHLQKLPQQPLSMLPSAPSGISSNAGLKSHVNNNSQIANLSHTILNNNSPPNTNTNNNTNNNNNNNTNNNNRNSSSSTLQSSNLMNVNINNNLPLFMSDPNADIDNMDPALYQPLPPFSMPFNL